MKNKKILSVVLVVALVASLAVGMTVAYLQDTDSNTNVMVVGSVYIDQNEWQLDENGNREAFEQNKPAIPGVYDGNEPGVDPATGLFTDDVKNEIDKMVDVTNTGKSAAYVRTLVAIECPDKSFEKLLHINSGMDYETVGYITVDGVNYLLLTYTYENPLLPGDTTGYSLKQIVLDCIADNEDVEKLGDEMTVLVYSQAVQSDGFANAETALNAAFGEVTTTNHPWAAVISDAADAENALKGNNSVILADDFSGTIEINYEVEDVTLDANGNNAQITIGNGAKVTDMTITGLNGDGTFRNISVEGSAQVENLLITDSTFADNSATPYGALYFSAMNTNVTITDCVFENCKYAVYGSTPVDGLTISNCDFINVSSWAVLLNGGDQVGANLSITDCTFDNCVGGIAKYLGSSQPVGASTVFSGNTLTNCAGHDGSDAKWFTIPGAAETVTVSNNTLDGADWVPGVTQGLGK